MRIIFSRDRAAQLDLLMQSLDKNAGPEQTEILWYASSEEFLKGYQCFAEERDLPFHTPIRSFNHVLRRTILASPDPTITFFCDDDVLYGSNYGASCLLLSQGFVAFSLRLASPVQIGDDVVHVSWAWSTLPFTDHGYPGSIDGHVFRVNDVIRMIGGDYIENPTQLETILARRCDLFKDRPLACFPEQRLVGIPVNRVSDDSGCPFGTVHPQTTSSLNKRYLRGKRIDFAALDFSGVSSCHEEMEFTWK